MQYKSCVEVLQQEVLELWRGADTGFWKGGDLGNC